MRTPGDDEDLAAGFLVTEGLVAPEAIAGYRLGDPGAVAHPDNTITALLRTLFDASSVPQRAFVASASCGICGKASLDDVERRSPPVGAGPLVSRAVLLGLAPQLRAVQPVFERTGGLHACATYDAGGALLESAEDVGRHNAVDAIAGRMWLDGIDGSDKIFYTTGRLTSEMVIKAAQMQIPFLVSRSGLTQMGWNIAARIGITMLGRAVNKHYLLFTGKQRFVRPVSPTLLA